MNYIINARVLTAFLPLEQELTLDSDKNYVFDLSYLTCLDVIGERRMEFLQGQLTCDLQKVHVTQMQQGALCNLKGRILALLDVIEWHGTHHLILPQDLVNETQTSLNKTALFSKVNIQKNAQYKLFGFQLNSYDDHIPFNVKLPLNKYEMIHTDDYCCYALGENLYVFIIKNTLEMIENLRGSLAWHALRLQAHQIEIYPESRGLFLPHRLGLQHSGHLSFNKGCYKGQEIIARTHYRAKLKHEMQLFIINTQAVLRSGLRLLSTDTQSEIGELIDFCPLKEGQYLIAISALFEHENEILIEGYDVIVELQCL